MAIRPSALFSARALLIRAAWALLLSAVAGCSGSSPGTPSSPSPPPPSPPVASPQGWALQEGSPQAPPNARHDDIVFLDENRGWLVNVRGEVYRTLDGGVSWQALARLPDVGPRCVGFVSADQGFIGILNSTNNPRPGVALWETTDGGRTWTNASDRINGSPVMGLCGMRVLGPRTVYAVGRWSGPPVFVKTTDGGRSWRSRSLQGLASGLVDLFFFNESEGFAVGGLGDGPTVEEQRASRTVVVATSDGGETWETRYLSRGVGQRGWKIHFVSDRVGFVSTEGSTPDGVVLKTTDGGRNWTPMLISVGESFEGIGFVTPERGWAGSFQTLYSTEDGGTTWRPLSFGLRINRMRVIHDGLVYAAGDRVYRWTR